jgi:DNA-binding transcriptional MerR regulator
MHQTPVGATSREQATEAYDGPRYSVGEAAGLAGISPSTIRLYEKQGLLGLRRTAGGHRYLTEEDLNALKRVRVLRRTQGLNLAAIRRDLERMALNPRPEPADGGGGTGRLGARIRAIRQQQGLTLREVGRKTNLSPSFLSSFERGLTGISVTHLQQLISTYNSSLVDVFAETGQEPKRLVRPEQRPRLALDDGAILIEDLAVVPRHIEVQMWTIQPGAGSEGAYSHAGEEAMYLISGTLEVQLNEVDVYSMAAGDCLYFASSELHRWSNPGSEPALVLWVNTPPTF